MLISCQVLKLKSGLWKISGSENNATESGLYLLLCQKVSAKAQKYFSLLILITILSKVSWFMKYLSIVPRKRTCFLKTDNYTPHVWNYTQK